jgi:hypothetical protein
MIVAGLGKLRANHIRLLGAILETLTKDLNTNYSFLIEAAPITSTESINTICTNEFLRELNPNNMVITKGLEIVGEEGYAFTSVNMWENTKEVSQSIKCTNYKSKADILYQSFKKNKENTALQYLLGEVNIVYNISYNEIIVYTNQDKEGLFYLIIPKEGVYFCSNKIPLEILKEFTQSFYEVTELDSFQMYKFVKDESLIKIHKLQRVVPIYKQVNTLPPRRTKVGAEIIKKKIEPNKFEVIGGLYQLNGETAHGVYYTNVDGSFVADTPFNNCLMLFFYKGILLKNIESLKVIIDQDIFKAEELQGLSLIPIPKGMFTNNYTGQYIIPEPTEWINPVIGESLPYVHGDFYYPFTNAKYTFENNVFISNGFINTVRSYKYWTPLFSGSSVEIMHTFEEILDMLHNLKSKIKTNPTLEKQYKIITALEEYLGPHIEHLK